MPYMERYQPAVKAPEFPTSLWLNTHETIRLENLVGIVVLIDFFDYTCINCIRMFPYLRAWQARYESHGLMLLGIHTPEFSFAHDPETVKAGINRLGIHWPVILDNDQTLWTAYANRYWPSLYLIDPEGKIRFRHIGEGGYRSFEASIQECLLEIKPDDKLPELLPPIHPEDAQGAFCAPTSPELQLGSIDQVVIEQSDPKPYEIPAVLEPDHIYLAGFWRVTQDGITLAGNEGEIAIAYRASKVHAILAPNPDDRERLPFLDEPLYIQVLQDGNPLMRSCFGQDVLAEGSNARFRVDFPRLYEIVENPAVEPHELRLKVKSPGLTFYALSFGSCYGGDRPPPRSKE
jgi:thiol-disulfide isomerase/thioredoxin